MRFHIALALAAASSVDDAAAFVSSPHAAGRCVMASRSVRCPAPLFMSTETTDSSVSVVEPTGGGDEGFPPILDELRDVAMRLHTREQAPREGQAEAPAKPAEPRVPTHMDYLQFLVDSRAVYEVIEEIVNGNEKLATFRNTGIERTVELEKDIAWMCEKFDLQRPDVGTAGMTYAKELKAMVESDDDIPEFMCHYYNYYFAHLAGGRMIGKQMSKLLLDGETLEFYKVSPSVVKTKLCLESCLLSIFLFTELLWQRLFDPVGR